MASGGPGSAKNDPKSARVTRKMTKVDSCKAMFIALVEGEGVQPWDIARCPWRIERYRFIMESSKSKPYSASCDILASWQAGSGSQHLLACWHAGMLSCRLACAHVPISACINPGNPVTPHLGV